MATLMGTNAEVMPGQTLNFPGRAIMKRRIEVTLESQRVILTRRRAVTVRAYCAACCGQVEMITPGEAAARAGVPASLIYRWLEAEQLHFMERADGVPLICSNSLLDRI